MIEAEDKGGGDGLRNLLKELKQGWGTDSEMTVAAVDDRKDDWNVALRLRVLLWAEHLRADPTDRVVWRELSDLSTGLSIFDPSWGRPISFQTPNTRLIPVTIE